MLKCLVLNLLIFCLSTSSMLKMYIMLKYRQIKRAL